MKRILIFFLIIGLAVIFCKTEVSAESIRRPESIWHTGPDKRNQSRIFHSRFDIKFQTRIVISRHIPNIDISDQNFSSNRAYWFMSKSADFTKPSPWSSSIYVYNERDYLVKIELKDHANRQLEVRWINEKLLYVQVWWGRALGSYFIFDTENEKVVIREMVQDGRILFNQLKETGRFLNKNE